MDVKFIDLVGEQPSERDLPILDRDSVDENVLTYDQKQWRREGVLIKPGLIPNELLDPYFDLRSTCESDVGWGIDTAYMRFSEIRDLCLSREINSVLTSLMFTSMGLHLNLCNWKSTERNWHQDDYLNPPFVNSWYVAVWIALRDIHPDSGPFQYVPGSHKWPLTRRENILRHLTADEQRDPTWPAKTQGWVANAFAGEIERQGAPIKTWVPRKGDVLFWHGRLVHRGSVPTNPDLKRHSLIAHYSALNHRFDMPNYNQWKNQGYYFTL